MNVGLRETIVFRIFSFLSCKLRFDCFFASIYISNVSLILTDKEGEEGNLDESVASERRCVMHCRTYICLYVDSFANNEPSKSRHVSTCWANIVRHMGASGVGSSTLRPHSARRGRPTWWEAAPATEAMSPHSQLCFVNTSCGMRTRCSPRVGARAELGIENAGRYSRR